MQPLLLEPGQDEAVDRIARPGGVPDRGGWRGPHRPPAPVRALAAREVEARRRARAYRRPAVRPGCPHFHPGGEVGLHRGRELSLRRHRQVGVLVGDGLDQATLLGASGDDRRPVVAPLEQRRPTVEAKPALHFRRTCGMALETVLDEDGTHLLLEELAPCRSWLRGLGDWRRQQQGEEQSCTAEQGMPGHQDARLQDGRPGRRRPGVGLSR